MSAIPRRFVEHIPKTDLHLHLDGSLRLETLIEMAKNEGVALPSQTQAGLCETVFKDSYDCLADYLRGFVYTCAVLRRREHLERVAYELAEDNISEGVRYIEVRYAPQLLVHDDLTIEETATAITAGLERAKREHNAKDAVKSGHDMRFEFGLILCAMRCFTRTMGPHYNKLLSVLQQAPRKEVFSIASLEMARVAVNLRDEKGLPIAGFDLAGEEAGYPAAYHTDAYDYAHRHFLRKTVHAGEAYGPESIFQAISDCHANRIGHGTFLFAHDMVQDPAVGNPVAYVEALAEYIANQRITMEVCLKSNLQTTPSIEGVEKHPLVHMLEHNLSVSICTDNRLVSKTTVTDELMRVADALPISTHQFRNVVIAGFKGSFFPGSYNAKRAFVRDALDLYEKLEDEMLR